MRREPTETRRIEAELEAEGREREEEFAVEYNGLVDEALEDDVGGVTRNRNRGQERVPGRIAPSPAQLEERIRRQTTA